jgi:integrase
MRQKITVTIERRSTGLLRLRFDNGIRRIGIPLGLRDSAPSQSIAMSIKTRMESDWVKGCFDHTLFSYRPQTTGDKATDILTTEVFQKFIDHKLKIGDISEHTASVNYAGTKRLLERRLNVPMSEVNRYATEDLTEYLKSTLTAKVGRQYIQLLNSCWEWAKGKYQSPGENPFEGLTGWFRDEGKKPIEVFSVHDVGLIKAGFLAHEPEYADFVAFLFGSGCRLGEAVALKWSAVDTKTVWIGESITGEFRNKTTKTGRARTILLSPSMATMLTERRERLKPSPTDFVFPNNDGTPIGHIEHRHRWKTVLKKVKVPYLRPYTTRATAISHALEAGATPVDIAAQTGHSVTTLLENYAGVITTKQVFIEF